MKKVIKLLNKIFIFFKRKNSPVEMKRVLLVSNTALGDTILSTPSIKTLRKSFPDLYIVLMVNKNVYKLFKDFEYVNDVIVYDKSFIGLIKHVLFIKKEKFDTVFFSHSNGPQDLFLALVSGVNNVLKAINYPSQVSSEFSSFILNKPDYVNKKHIIEHRLDLVKYFKPNFIDKDLSLPRKFYKNKTENNLITIAIQLGAADTYKMWPLDNFVIFLNLIYKDFKDNYNIKLFGIESERQLAQYVIDNVSYNNNIENLCGKTDICELPIVLQESDLLITNDTGTLHLAVALQIPTISLFSPTDSKIFGPYQDFDIHKIIQKDGEFINNKPKKQRTQEAMELITINEVYNTVLIQLNRINKCAE